MTIFKQNTHIHQADLVPLEVGDLQLLLHLDHVGDGLEEHLDKMVMSRCRVMRIIYLDPANVDLSVCILLEGVIVLRNIPVLFLLLER